MNFSKLLPTLILALAFSSMGLAQNTMTYLFNGNLNSEEGGPALTVENPGTFSGDGEYIFPQNPVIVFENGDAGDFIGDAYTFETYFKLDDVGGYKKIFDWKNRNSDCGYYFLSGWLSFYCVGSSYDNQISADTYVHLVFRRKADSQVDVYIDGVNYLTADDYSQTAVLDADNRLVFFTDDFATGQYEATSGAVQGIRMYDEALDDEAFFDLINGGFVETNVCDTDTDKPVWVDGCPENFEITTDQYTCTAYLDLPAPAADDICLVEVAGRIRQVDPVTHAHIGPWMTPWTADDLSGAYPAGTYKVRWRAKDKAGNKRNCHFFVTINEDLPCGWMQYSGGVGCDEGSIASFDSDTETFWLSSNNCYNSNTVEEDSYAFAQQELCGNGSITVRVNTMDGSNNGWAGVMMRASNDPQAPMVSLATNRSSNHRKSIRTSHGAMGTTQTQSSFNRHWLRIVRTGNSFRGYASSNGTSWFLKFSHTVPMQSCIEIGLILSSYVSSGNQTASFDNVVIEGNFNSGAAFTGGALQTVDNSQTFEAYPNPTNDLATLSLKGFIGETGTLEVINTFGQIVLTKQLGVIEEAKQGLDLSTFPNGVYMVRLMLEERESKVIQVIKQ